MKRIKKIWDSISNFGITSDLNTTDAKRIRLTNRLGIIAVLFTLPYIIGFACVGCYYVVFLLSCFSVVYFSTIFINYLKGYRSARLTLYLMVLIHQFVMASIYGEKAEIHLLYIALVLLPIVFFDRKKDIRLIIFCIGITIVAMLLLYATNFSLLSVSTSSSFIRTLNICYKITTMAGVVVILLSSIAVSEKTERILDEDNFFLENQLKAIFDNSYDAIFLVDLKSKSIIKVNKRAVELFEADSENQLLGRSGLEFHKEKISDIETQKIRLALVNNGNYQSEILYRTEKLNEFWGAIAIRLLVIRDKKYQMVRITDITLQHEINEKLKSSLHEKEILLAEIHHRVKNNMAVISGLLGLQSSYIENEKAKELFEESRNRIHSMAMIHDKLYQHETFAKIDFCAYINDLVEHIKNSYNSTNAELKFSVICNDIFLDIKNAVPCGLILNELISNSCKHAFKGRQNGEIKIVCTKMGEKFTMMVSDNGVGFDAEEKLKNPNSLGLTLIKALVDQINANVKSVYNNGTTYYISFEA